MQLIQKKKGKATKRKEMVQIENMWQDGRFKHNHIDIITLNVSVLNISTKSTDSQMNKKERSDFMLFTVNSF